VIVNSKAQFCNITEFKRGHRAVIDAIKHKFVTGVLYTVFVTAWLTFITEIGAGQKDAIFYGSLYGALAAIHSTMRDEEEAEFDNTINRLLAVKLFAILLASGVIGASGNASVGAAMGAIGAAFVGSLIAGALSRKAIKSIANATIFAISLGALVGTAIAAIVGTVPGTISGAITAGVVAITFDNLEATFRTALATGMFSETVKTVAGVIMALPREEAYAIVVATILGVILINSLNYYNIIMLGNGAIFGAPMGAVFATAFYLKYPNVMDPIRIFYLILITSMVRLGINLVFGEDNIITVMSRLLFAALFHIFLPGTPLFNLFIILAAIGVMFFFLPMYIIGLFTHIVDFLAPVGITVLIAVTGAAIGGYLLAVVVNMAGLRVNGAFTRLNDQSIAAVRRILRSFNISIILGAIAVRRFLRTIDVSIILGAVGAVVGTSIAFFIELNTGEMLTGVIMTVILGATTAIPSGAIATVAMAIIMNITIPVITNCKMCTDQEIKKIIAITTVSAFIGVICGAYFEFTSSIVAGGLVALAFPVVTVVIYTASLYAERRHRFKRVNWVPLVRVMNRIGIEWRNLVSEETQNNWIRYKVAKVQ
jgi:hypothetical protein